MLRALFRCIVLAALATLALAQPLPAADPPSPTRLQALKAIEDPEPVARRTGKTAQDDLTEEKNMRPGASSYFFNSVRDQFPRNCRNSLPSTSFTISVTGLSGGLGGGGGRGRGMSNSTFGSSQRLRKAC